MAKNKKAMLIDLNLTVRVIMNGDIDIDTDIDEVNHLVLKTIQARIKEEGPAFIGEGIEDYQDDLENPYDPEHDA